MPNVYGKGLQPAPMQHSHRNQNRLYLLGAAFLFSTGGAAIKACSLNNWQVAGFRSGVAAVVLWLLLPGARRGWTLRTWLTGAAYAATLILFVTANKLTTSANAIFLQSTAPLYLCLLGPLLLREKIRRVDLVVMGAVAAGALLLLSAAQSGVATAPEPAKGNWIGLVSGLTWALTIAGLRMLSKEKPAAAGESATAAVIVGNIIAFIVCLPFALPVEHISAADAGAVFYLGAFQIGLAYVLLTRSLLTIPALEASTLLLVEPALNPLWTLILNGENPGMRAIAGGAVIALAALIPFARWSGPKH